MPIRTSARTASILVAALVLGATVGVPVRAQEPGPVSITLVSQPIWHEPKDAFDLRLRITNEGSTTLEGFRLQVRVFDSVGSRSDLHENFEVDPTRFESGSFPVDHPDQSVVPGEATTVTIDENLNQVGFLASSTIRGVYPLTVTVTDNDGLVALDTLTTQLIYLPTPVEVPLNVAFVWPFGDLPARGAGGVFEADPTTSMTRLETALDENGWLTGIAAAMASPPAEDLRLGVAPEPRLIEEIGDMSDGYPRAEGEGRRTVPSGNEASRAAATVLDQIRAPIEAGDVQPILAPYSMPDLPSLEDLEHLSSQLTAGEAVLEEVLRVTPGRAWIFPPGGRLDDATLERLHASGGAASTFFSGDSLEEPVEGADPACRVDFVGITYTCPVSVTTPAGQARGFVLDAELQERFTALKSLPADAVLLQRLFAEIMMIWAELPSVADRVVALSAPPLWHPPPRVSTRFVRALARAPWINAVAPSAGLRLGIGAIERDLVPEADVIRTRPDDTYLQAIDEATDVVDSFGLLQPPEGLIQRLQRDVLVAQSRMWWGDDLTLQSGVEFAEEARREAENELAKISIGGRDDITLTSSTGPVPMVLENNTGYNVSLEIHIESTDRDLEISDRIISDTFEPGATNLPVEASARASGIYPVRIRVTTSDGYEVHQTSIRIRSTEFNEIALGITVGALAFLVMFYLFRSGRRKKASLAQDTA